MLPLQELIWFVPVLALLVLSPCTLRASENSTLQKQEVQSRPSVFTVQIGAFSSKESADQVLRELRQAEADCFITRTSRFLKVYCGRYQTMQEATRLKNRLSALGFRDAFPVKTASPAPEDGTIASSSLNKADQRSPRHVQSLEKEKNEKPILPETDPLSKPSGQKAAGAEEGTAREQAGENQAGNTSALIQNEAPSAQAEKSAKISPPVSSPSGTESPAGHPVVTDDSTPASTDESTPVSSPSKKGFFVVVSLVFLFIAALLLLSVIVLRRRGAVQSLNAARLLRKHRDLLTQLSGEDDADDDVLDSLRRINNTSSVELILDKAATTADKPVAHFQRFYDAVGITDRYIEVLKNSKSWKKRAFATEKLGHIGSAKAVPLLLSIIRDVNNEDEDVRTIALRALGRIKDKRAIPALIEALGSPETWLPPRIGEILVNIGDDCIDHLKQELKNFESESRRGWAAEILGWLDAKSAVTALIEALFDVSPEVRAKTAGALGKIRSERAIVRLTELLISEPVPFVRTRVSQALGAIGNPVVIHYLVNILKDPEWWVRLRAVEALEQLGEQSVSSLLVAMEDEDAEVRRRAALALERIGYIQKILKDYGKTDYKPELRKILFLVAQAGVIESLCEKITTSEKHLKKRIVRLLGEAGTKEASEPLLELLQVTSDWTLKSRIIQSLGKIGATEAIPFLIENLKDSQYWVRRAAVEALGMLDARDFSHDVVTILEDPNPLARESALRALSMLKVTSHWDKIENLLLDPSPKVRAVALKVMRELGITTKREKIIEILAEASEEVRVEAIRYFSAIIDQEVLPEVVKLIPLASEPVRQEIIEYMRRVKPERFQIVLKLLSIEELSTEALAAVIEIASIIKDDDAYRFILDFTGSLDSFIREMAFRAIASFGFAENEEIFEKALFDPSRGVRTIVLACIGSASGDVFLEKAKVLARDPDEDVRLALTLAFGASGHEKFRPLIKDMLDDPSLKVVAGAFISLACFNDPLFLEVFYSRSNITELRGAVRTISEDSRFSSIIDDIRDKARNSRNLEVGLLFARNDREFGHELIRRLKEALDPVIRLKAMEVLKLIATPEFFTSILGIMKKDPFADVRIHAMEVITVAGREDDVISALASSLLDPSPDVRIRAAELLGKYRNPKSLEALLHVLDTTDRQFRESITTSLSLLLTGDTDKVTELVKSVPETKTRKLGMAWLMGKSRKHGSVKFLVGLLEDRDPEVRAAAVGALGKFMKKQFLNHLGKLIYDPNERVRAAAVNAIAATGGERAFEIVMTALEDIDDFVRMRAAIGLAKMDLKRSIHVLQRKISKYPEVRSYLDGVLYASGLSENSQRQLDSVAVNVVDELSDKKELMNIFKQSSDRERRIHAFHVLALTLGENDRDLVEKALQDPVPEIRTAAKKYSMR